LGCFWIFSAWPSGLYAVLEAGIFSALYATYPNPSRAARFMTYGFSVGFVVALFVKFFILPSIDGFWLLCMAVAPVMFVGSYICTIKKYAAFGSGIRLFFSTTLAPLNVMNFNPVATINNGMAQVAGVAFSAVMFGALIPKTSHWQKERMSKRLRSQIELVSSAPLTGLPYGFESSTRELFHTLVSTQEADKGRELSLMLSVLEVGKAVILLRQESVGLNYKMITGEIESSINLVARYFKKPTELNMNNALASVENTVSIINYLLANETFSESMVERYRRISRELYIIRTSLLDEESVLNPESKMAGKQGEAIFNVS
ncbi:MAG: FUSC family protein, partial [Desulfuromonadales bacterium]|nr:FUSC family protein [Desulfuromonadales bacterium]